MEDNRTIAYFKRIETKIFITMTPLRGPKGAYNFILPSSILSKELCEGG